MNRPEVKSYTSQAVDIVVSVINKAKEALGERMTLKQLVDSRDLLTIRPKVTLTSLRCPLVITSENLIRYSIERKWKLTDKFLYMLKYMGSSNDECSLCYYFEAIFSQPNSQYPIPQTVVSVFFRVEDKYVKPREFGKVPKVTFRIEGQRQDHDIRYVLLTADRLMGILMIKKKLFKRIEEIDHF